MEQVVTLATIRAALGDRWPVAEGPGWLLVHGDNREILPMLPDRCASHWIGDPPYGERTHTNHRVGTTNAYKGVAASPSRSKSLGFDALSAEHMRLTAEQIARVVTRWSLTFCEIEQVAAWKAEAERAGTEYVRTGAWIKPGSTPQFSGDRPAVGFETIVIGHAKGRKRWNGGGKHAVWTVPIVKPQTGERLHTTPKPIELMEALTLDFTDPGDVVVDGFAGSGTEGLACINLGRLFVGIERLPLPGIPIDDENNPDYFGIACRRLSRMDPKPREEQPSLFAAIGGA